MLKNGAWEALEKGIKSEKSIRKNLILNWTKVEKIVHS